jgi:hypothetical protein
MQQQLVRIDTSSTVHSELVELYKYNAMHTGVFKRCVSECCVQCSLCSTQLTAATAEYNGRDKQLAQAMPSSITMHTASRQRAHCNAYAYFFAVLSMLCYAFRISLHLQPCYCVMIMQNTES